jgi:hypothetical protein
MTGIPFAARCRAIALPMPRDAPVIKAYFILLKIDDFYFSVQRYIKKTVRPNIF